MLRRFMLLLAVALLIAACGDDTQTGPSSEASTPIADDAGDPTSAPLPEPTDTPPPADEPTTEADSDGIFPDVVDVVAREAGGQWTFDVTLSSPYDSPARYADAWRVLAPDGTELGVRELLHDHAGEQPFTRSLSGVDIPDDIAAVTVEGRDQINGWGGATVTIVLER